MADPSDMPEPPSPPPYRHLRQPTPRRRPQRIIVPLVVLLFIAVIAYDRMPGLRVAVERFLHPADYQAREACERAALAAAAQPAYARVHRPGKVHRTVDAYYVEQVIVGEMGESGSETRYAYSCYVDSAGQVVRGSRAPALDRAP